MKAKDTKDFPLTAQPQASALAEATPGCFVQPVPSHCDRITWRGNYYQLPDGLTQASAAQSDPSTGIYSSDPLACPGCAKGCFRCMSKPPSAPAGERETIRAVFLRNGFTVKEGQTDLKPYVYAAAEELLSIARASWHRTQSAGVPDGWRLVPEEPTEEMLAATTTSKHPALRAEVMRMMREDYRAMLAACKGPDHG